jgi:hypothetical protein
LPNPDEAFVPRAKIVDYLLSLEHPEGRGKASFFRGHGFTDERWENLAEALRRHAIQNDLKRTEPSPFGTRYIIEGEMETPDGRRPRVRVVWFVGITETVPRLATAYPMARDDR